MRTFITEAVLAILMSDRPTFTGPEHPKEIEITPEMIAAGWRVLCNSGRVDECLEADTLLVENIYRAMVAFRRQE